IRNGPFSIRHNTPNSLRLALLAPRADMGRLRNVVSELQRSIKPREAVNYYPEYPGFEALFRVPIEAVAENHVLHFPDALNAHAERGAKAELARGLFQTIAQLGLIRTSFDVALIYLPQSWAACFEGENFDFHDYLKAFCAPSNIPIQIIRQSS